MHNNKAQRTPTHRPRRFWILGAGRFGQIAVKRIRKHIRRAEIIVVDEKPPESGLGAETLICADGVAWLAQNLAPRSPVDMVVPAIPVHVVAGWLRRRLGDRFDSVPMDVPERWIAQLPNPMRGQTGQVYVSHADFICPDDCPEPAAICTHTGKPRPTDLFKLLAKVKLEAMVPIVVRSHQLLPGVGGIHPGDLFTALEKARAHFDRPLMIATACRCHGVIDFLRLIPKKD